MNSRTPPSAEDTLSDLRRTLTRWERNLSVNLARYGEEGAKESARSTKTQLDIVQDVLNEIGR